MIKLATYNCHNFKSNYNTVKKLIDSNDIIFVIEHWLAEEELNTIKLVDSNDFNVIFSSDFSLSHKDCGRPFGGKAWFIKKNLKILSCIDLSQNINAISIQLSNQQKFQIYGYGLDLMTDQMNLCRILKLT